MALELLAKRYSRIYGYDLFPLDEAVRRSERGRVAWRSTYGSIEGSAPFGSLRLPSAPFPTHSKVATATTRPPP